MHSTLQTGIYSPNMLGLDHHHHPHHQPPHYHHNHHYHRAPSPARLHHNKHYNRTGDNMARGRVKLGSSTNVSLLAIDDLNNNNSSKMGSNKLNLSTSNISKYSSSRNLNNNNNGVSERKKSIGDGGSSRSSSIKFYYASAVNLSRNVSCGNVNETGKDHHHHHNGGGSSLSITSNTASHNNQHQHTKRPMRLGDRINAFCDCSKPCGYMTLVLGCLLITSSVAGFVLLYERSVCARADTCGHQLVKTSTIMALVFGIMFCFLGFVIVVYSKKDIKTTVIITSAKNISKIAGVTRKHHHHHHQEEEGGEGTISATIHKENSNLSQHSKTAPAATDHLLLPTIHSTSNHVDEKQQQQQ